MMRYRPFGVSFDTGEGAGILHFLKMSLLFTGVMSTLRLSLTQGAHTVVAIPFFLRVSCQLVNGQISLSGITLPYPSFCGCHVNRLSSDGLMLDM